MHARFVIGIDLGTTNSALACVDTGAGDAAQAELFMVPQVVQPGVVEARPLLPSFLYLPGPGEQPVGALKLPWDAHRDFAVGEFARNFGAKVPTRLVSSAKSWLGHGAVDRKAAILPFRAGEADRRLSPWEACTRYLQHLAEAWNAEKARTVPEHRFEAQEIILTVPASFDAAARELTVEAARAAGIVHLTLLEEPQAAFYAWLHTQGEGWRSQVAIGDLVLVADVGGGTTDFTLIAVDEEAGNLALTRLAVGDHLLLGGDNMDLALAHAAAAELAQSGKKLDAGQMLQLTHAARQAKEQLFANPSLSAAPVTVLGKGRSVIGSSIQHGLRREQVEQIILNGFFPDCPVDAVPARNRAAGLQELGLPYVADAGITRHLAHFLHRQAAALAHADRPHSRQNEQTRPGLATLPTVVLFNGGVFQARLMRERLLAILGNWAATTQVPAPRALSGADLDLAVARGAAYYGLVRRGQGVRIRGGTGRAYYIGVETAQPAIPGLSPPMKAVCVAPFGMEEGTETDIPAQEFGLVVGEEVEFRFLGSTVRHEDAPGTVIDDWEGQIDELAPVRVKLAVQDAGTSPTGGVVPVHLHTKVTEVGQLELWCHSRDGQQRWKLEYSVRDPR
ncbi:MAG: Hsp70 family protein [Bacteroidales bacterium]|nr:Hsp70 family protein [Bacteroidales bacterium]